MKRLFGIILSILMIASLAACSTTDQSSKSTSTDTAAVTTAITPTADNDSNENVSSDFVPILTEANVTADGMINATELFTERDLRQNADLSAAATVTVKDSENVNITAGGTYVLTGSATNVTVMVEVLDDEKVQLVLDGLSITNTSAPVIYVKNADKVFVTTTDSENTLAVTGTFSADGETNTDAVIYSKDDLVLNGLGTLTISSSDNGISAKDDLKITGGTINIKSSADAIEANDSIAVADGTLNITTDKDGLHAENDEDNTQGYIYICGGTFNISAASDGIQATTVLQIDDGTIDITAAEGLEATFVQINGGTINIAATDDGINGSYKSTAYTVTVEFNGGTTTIDMGQGDTDAVDSNGNLYINGGTIDITAQSPFDYDGTAQKNGGTIIVNGTETDQITNQMMGGGMGGMGGMGDMGGMGGMGGNGAPGGFGGFGGY